MDQTDHDFTQLANESNDNNNSSNSNIASTMNDDIETGRRRPSKTGYFAASNSSSSIPLVDQTNAVSSFQHTDDDNTYNAVNNYSNAHNTQQQQQQHHPPKSLRHQTHAFLTMSTPYFTSSPRARKLFTLMLLLTLLNSGIRVYFSYLARDFWNALSDKDPQKFYTNIVTFGGAMVILTPVSVAYRYVRQMLAIDWRDWMTGRVLGLFMSRRGYYALERCYDDTTTTSTGTNCVNGKDSTVVDNPDQRISEDIRSFTEFSLSLFLTTLTAIIDLICFSIILFTIMPRLFLAIFLFASLGTILTVWIGKRLIGLNYEGLQKEADFRFALVRIRENAESIAFYCGEGVEKRETERRFGRVIENMG